MNLIQRSALVPYSARQMFELVNNIDEYPQFLPWCSKSEVHHVTAQEIEATLTISWSGIHKSFTTKNVLTPFDRIEIQLINGPFHHLQGNWSFIALAPDACKVCLDLEVEFTGSLIDKLFQPVFNHIANTLVEAFSKRAVDVYGKD